MVKKQHRNIDSGSHTVPRAYHYTIGLKARLIYQSGELRPTSVGVEPPEVPILWFSSSPHYEPTAYKATMAPTGRRYLTWDEMVMLRPHRFIVDQDKLLPWYLVQSRSRMSPQLIRGLESEGRAVGADPANWYGLFEPVRLENLVGCEVFINQKWEPVW